MNKEAFLRKLAMIYYLMLHPKGADRYDLLECIRDLDLEERGERTFYRDIRELRQIGANIECRDGKYYLLDEPNIFKQKPSLEEYKVLFTSVYFLSKHRNTPFEKPSLKLLDKMYLEIPKHLRARMKQIIKWISIGPDQIADYNGVSKSFKLIEWAISEKRRLEAKYFSFYENMTYQFFLDPYGLKFDKHWYAIGYDHYHQDIRTFKIKRFREVRLTKESFKHPVDFSLDDFFGPSWRIFREKDIVKVKAKFSARVAPLIKERAPHPSQKIEKFPDGAIIFTVSVSGMKEISLWLLTFGAEAEVLEPQELRQKMIDTAREMLKLYDEEK